MFNKILVGIMLSSPFLVSAKDSASISVEAPIFDFANLSIFAWLGILLFSLVLGYLSSRSPKA